MADKVRFELRFDADVHEGIRRLAEGAEISVNQLMQGLARWAVENGHVGEPARSSAGILYAKEQAGCVFFGKLGVVYTEEEQLKYLKVAHEDREEEPGSVVFLLDFTERRVIREGAASTDAP